MAELVTLGVGSLHRFRDAIESGWPTPLEIEEHSHAGMVNRYVAGASDLPFAVLRGYRGTDLVGQTANIRTVTYVAEVSGGAHPSYAQGYTERDNEYYQAWDAISRDRTAFSRWRDDLAGGGRPDGHVTGGVLEGSGP